MANDALDPGEDGTFPFMPRNPDGTIDRKRMPTTPERHRRRDRSPLGEVEDVVDPTPEQVRPLLAAEEE